MTDGVCVKLSHTRFHDSTIPQEKGQRNEGKVQGRVTDTVASNYQIITLSYYQIHDSTVTRFIDSTIHQLIKKIFLSRRIKLYICHSKLSITI